MPIVTNQALILVLVMNLVVVFFLVCRRKPVVAVFALMLVVIVGRWGVDGEIVVGGFQVYAADLTCTVMLVSSLLRRSTRFESQRLVGLMLVLLGVALIRGVVSFGVAQGVNASRESLYFFSVLIFAATSRLTWKQVEAIWVLAAVFLSLVSLVFFVANGLGTYAQDGERAVNSPEALIVAQAAVLLFGRQWSRRRAIAGSFFLVIVLASQQRTVWAATVAMILVIAVARGTNRERFTRRRVRTAIVSATIVLVGFMAAGPAGLRDSVGVATSTVSLDSGTFGWRVESAQALIDRYWSKQTLDQLIGQPSGEGIERVIGGNVWSVSAHNMYLSILVSFGALGLAVFLFLLSKMTVLAFRASTVVGALVLSTWVYSLGYQLTITTAVLLGLVLTTSRRTRDREDALIERDFCLDSRLGKAL